MDRLARLRAVVAGEATPVDLPRQQSVKMTALDRVGAGLLTPRDVYKQRHRLNKKRVADNDTES